jgi:hypothetical protein
VLTPWLSNWLQTVLARRVQPQLLPSALLPSAPSGCPLQCLRLSGTNPKPQGHWQGRVTLCCKPSAALTRPGPPAPPDERLHPTDQAAPVTLPSSACATQTPPAHSRPKRPPPPSTHHPNPPSLNPTSASPLRTTAPAWSCMVVDGLCPLLHGLVRSFLFRAGPRHLSRSGVAAAASRRHACVRMRRIRSVSSPGHIAGSPLAPRAAPSTSAAQNPIFRPCGR